jgi:hypothetical protein
MYYIRINSQKIATPCQLEMVNERVQCWGYLGFADVCSNHFDILICIYNHIHTYYESGLEFPLQNTSTQVI